jgi:hypothetical protein
LLETLDLALPFMRQLGGRLYLWLTAVLVLPGLAAVAALHYALGLEWFWIWLIGLVMASLLEGAFTVAAGQLMFSPTVRLRDVLLQYGRSLGALSLARGVSWLFILLSSFTIVFPLILWIRHQFIHEVVALEGVRARALDRSRRIASEGGAPGAALGIWLLFGRIFMVVGAELVLGSLVDEVFELGQPLGTLWQHGGSLYALAGLFASIPFIATARFLAYVDQRTRTDAWDVQVRFLGIRGAVGGGA